jgi:hypothetical protein
MHCRKRRHQRDSHSLGLPITPLWYYTGDPPEGPTEVVFRRRFRVPVSLRHPPGRHVGVRAVVEQPFQGPGRQALAGGADDGVVPAPEGVHVGAVGDEQLHHGDAHVGQRRPHEWPVAALMHVGPVLDHPPRHREPRFTGGHPRHAAFGDPRQRPILAVTQRRAMELRVASHHLLDPLEVVRVDRLLELPDGLQRFDVGFELGPARKAILAGNLKLCVGQRRRLTCSEQVLGLILEMPQVGMLGKLARRSLRGARHGNLLSVWRPVSARRAERRFVSMPDRQVGFYPFRGPDASCTQTES